MVSPSTFALAAEQENDQHSVNEMIEYVKISRLLLESPSPFVFGLSHFGQITMFV